MKRIFSAILALLMVLSLVACAKQETEPTPAPTQLVIEPTEPTVALDVYAEQNYALKDIADRLKLLSRATVTGKGIDCDQTASGIEFEAYVQPTATVPLICVP